MSGGSTPGVLVAPPAARHLLTQMIPDAVLLDWEGVLVDTAAARRSALLGALAEEGVAFDAGRFDECCRGLDVPSAARAALAARRLDDVVLADLVALRAERTFAESLAGGFLLRDGAAELVARLQLDCPVIVVSRAGRAETDMVLGLSGLREAVSASVCEDEHPGTNAWSAALERLSRRRPARAERSIALCADTRGLALARQAGLRVVAVGLPAHQSLGADAGVEAIRGLTAGRLYELGGLSPASRSA